ncbi:GGDEF domain-containing protein [Ochrobactrum vermis]|nr:GGDEF domain-containing protein [Ochrobactrum vermis]
MTVRMMSLDAHGSMTERKPFSVPANEIERLESVRSLVSVTSLGLPELDTLVSLVKDVFGVSTSALNIVDEDWQRVAANAGEKVSSCPRELTACTFVVESGKLFVIENMVENDFFCAMPYVTGEPRFRFYAGAPVSVENGLVVGSLCILDNAPRQLSDTERTKLEDFARIASGLLRLQKTNKFLNDDSTALKRLALTDRLTKLYNRGALTELAVPLIEKALQQGKPIGALLIDLDRFKAVNDTYGHLMGDTLLIEAARRLRSALRETDIPVRVGGDEFAVILPDEDCRENIELVAGRVVEAFRVPFVIHGVNLDVSASVGAVLAPRDGSSPEALARNADIALYAAKSKGRNCYSVFGESESKR